MRVDRVAVVLMVTAWACSSDGGASWGGSVTDSAGITIVRNPTSGLWGDGEGWTFTEALRIGSAEGENARSARRGTDRGKSAQVSRARC